MFLSYTITQKDYTAFKNDMQMSKHHRRSMSPALRGSEIRIRLHLHFQSWINKKRREKCTFFVLLYLQESFYNSFAIYLLPGLVCLRGENSKLILHLKYFYFCLFLTSISVSRPQLKTSTWTSTKVSLSACKAQAGAQSQDDLPSFTFGTRRPMCVCPSWTCVRRGQTLGVSRTRLCSRTSSII